MSAVADDSPARLRCTACEPHLMAARTGTEPVHPEHRSLLVVDIEGFSRPERLNPIQLWLRRQLRRMLTDGLAEIGAVGECEFEDRGDGFLVSIGSAVPKNLLIDPLIPTLARRLTGYNRAAAKAEQMRLRVVLHAGEVLRDPQPNVGHAAILATRLLDAQELRATLSSAATSLVLIVSDWVYQEVVQHRYGEIDPSSYRPVEVHVKGIDAHAWIHVPGHPATEVAAGTVLRQLTPIRQNQHLRLG
jgi:hypothetical protein